jgi:hypothetical protein
MIPSDPDWAKVPCGRNLPHFVFTKPIQKSQQDDREYRLIRLENGLHAMLIHDAKADKAAASLNVAVGHLSDPVSVTPTGIVSCGAFICLRCVMVSFHALVTLRKVYLLLILIDFGGTMEVVDALHLSIYMLLPFAFLGLHVSSDMQGQ